MKKIVSQYNKVTESGDNSAGSEDHRANNNYDKNEIIIDASSYTKKQVNLLEGSLTTVASGHLTGGIFYKDTKTLLSIYRNLKRDRGNLELDLEEYLKSEKLYPTIRNNSQEDVQYKTLYHLMEQLDTIENFNRRVKKINEDAYSRTSALIETIDLALSILCHTDTKGKEYYDLLYYHYINPDTTYLSFTEKYTLYNHKESTYKKKLIRATTSLSKCLWGEAGQHHTQTYILSLLDKKNFDFLKK